MAAIISQLDRRAFHTAKRTKNTTIPLQRFKPNLTTVALIIIPTGIGRHNFFLLITAFGASNFRHQDHLVYLYQAIDQAQLFHSSHRFQDKLA